MIHWKEFFDSKHESKMQERRRMLMALNKVTVSDIETTMLKLSQEEETILKQKPLIEDVITLDDSSDEDNGNAVAAANDGQNNMENRNISAMQTSSEDASLLATLRLLASLDSGKEAIIKRSCFSLTPIMTYHQVVALVKAWVLSLGS